MRGNTIYWTVHERGREQMNWSLSVMKIEHLRSFFDQRVNVYRLKFMHDQN